MRAMRVFSALVYPAGGFTCLPPLQKHGFGLGLGFGFGLGLVLFYGIKVTIGLRVSPEEESKGLDIGEHGMEAYSGFQIFSTT